MYSSRLKNVPKWMTAGDPPQTLLLELTAPRPQIPLVDLEKETPGKGMQKERGKWKGCASS